MKVKILKVAEVRQRIEKTASNRNKLSEIKDGFMQFSLYKNLIFP